MFSTTKYYNKYVLKAITHNLVIHPVLNPVRTCGKYSDYNANTGMLHKYNVFIAKVLSWFIS